MSLFHMTNPSIVQKGNDIVIMADGVIVFSNRCAKRIKGCLATVKYQKTDEGIEGVLTFSPDLYHLLFVHYVDFLDEFKFAIKDKSCVESLFANIEHMVVERFGLKGKKNRSEIEKTYIVSRQYCPINNYLLKQTISYRLKNCIAKFKYKRTKTS